MATDYNSKYSGEQVEALLDQVASGNAGGGGGGGITVETDPIFSASPAATITEEDIAEWNGAADLVKGHDTDISQLFNDIEGKQDALVSGENIKTINGESIVGSGDITIEQGPKGDTGADGEDGATFTPSVDAAGNLSWTNNKGLTNPPTVNIKGPKGDKGDAGEGGGSSGGVEGGIQWTMRDAGDYIDDNGVIELDPFVVYYNGYFSGNATILFNGDDDYSEWRILFYIGAGNSLTINVDSWVNGITPNISAGGMYELSVVSNAGGHYGVIAHFPI